MNMKKLVGSGGGFALTLFCLAGLFVSVSAQLSLRKALDTDADGKADFTVFRPSNNVWYTSKSAGGFSFTQFGLTGQDYPTPGDFDGDGKGDIAVWRDTDGVWYYLKSNGNVFGGVQFGATGDEPVARDFDGDGKTDPAVVRRTNGNMIWYVLRSTDGGFSAVQFGLSTDFTAPGDYDGDGKFDYAIQRPGADAASQSTFYILKSAGGVTIVGFGLSNDLVVPGDYDGDGKTDIAVLREGATPTSNLVWYVLRSSDGAFFFRSFGLTGSDLATQNDYDGDGITDIAVWRDTDGNFYVLKSNTNFTSYFGAPWGSASDYPVASYDTH
jgi:hypothetical protein